MNRPLWFDLDVREVDEPAKNGRVARVRNGWARQWIAIAFVLSVLQGATASAVREGTRADLDVIPSAFEGAGWIAAVPDAQAAQAGGNVAMPIFRSGFVLGGRPISATLRICGLGQYEAHINGRNVTSAVLTPGWTLYTKRVLFNTYDVTKLLRPGSNAIGVMLGNGMYNVVAKRGRYSKFERSFGQPKLIAELTVHVAKGPDVILRSGADWKTTPGPITFSSVYGGEDYDARREPAGWDFAGFDDSAWAKARVVDGPGGVLVSETTAPVRALQRFRPMRVTHPKRNLTVYDLGQNFSGWPAIRVAGPRGAWVKLLAGELLNPDGEVTQRSGGAGPDDPNLFTYTLRGSGTAAGEAWHPRFSYYGFRYVQVERSSPAVTVLAMEGRFLHDDVRRIGTFTSSDPLLNRIHALIDNAMLSNMVSVLTDCPQREKLGWLEQSHLAGASLAYNWELSRLYDKISDDMADSQLADGLVPSIAPEFPVFEDAFRDSPEWGSAVILSPWTAYQFSGDVQPLRLHYNSMRRYAGYLEAKARDRLLAYGLGDWYDIGPGEPGESKLTTKGLTASAIYYQDLVTMAKIAVLTDHAGDADGYAAQAEAVKNAFNKTYFDAKTGLYDRGSQTAQAMPLVLGLVPRGQEAAVLAGLVAAIRVNGNHVTAGDIGFHSVVRALTNYERPDVLFDMLSRTDAPSYGAQLGAGATSLTEAWDANPRDSQNHFMLGHAEEWFYRGLAGIDFDRSRGKGEAIRIAPAVVGTLASVSATLNSSLGMIKSAWHRAGPDAEALTMDVEVPAHARARVRFPAGYRGGMRVDGHAVEGDGRIERIEASDGVAEVILRGGLYHFVLRRGE